MTNDQLNPYTAFNTNEAFGLLDTIVAHSEHKDQLDDLDISFLGIVAGLLEINDEVEVVIRFPKYLEQATKSEYLERYCVVPDIDSHNN